MSTIPQEVLSNLIPGFCGPNGGGVLTGDPAKPIRCNPGTLTMDQAHFIALWLETLLFGFFVPLYAVCVWIIFRRHNLLTPVAWALLAVSTLMFALASAHISINLTHTLESSFGDVSPLLHLGFSDVGFLSKTGIYFLQTIISDTFLVYRCWIVWRRNWKVVAVQLVLILAHFGIGIALIRELGMPKQLSSTEFDDEYIALFSAALGLTLVANGSATALIGYRVWKARSTLAGAKNEALPLDGPDLNRIIEVLLESGIAYFLALVALLVSYIFKSNSHFIILDSMTPFVGIVFTLIVIRVAMGRSYGSVRELRVSTSESHLEQGLFRSDMVAR